MSEVYEYVDDNLKVDENCLTVDFYFTSDVNKEKAVALVDNIMSNVKDYSELLSHRPAIFTKSPFVSEDV